jgi:putative resolvase
MKLAEWAQQNGLCYHTAYRLYRSGKFPLLTEQLPTGTILVHPPRPPSSGQPRAALYARVSSRDQRADLERQLQRLRDYATANGLQVVQELTKVGSGLNDHRKKLLRLLADSTIPIIVVEHKDRLARFGYDYLTTTLKAANRELRVLNTTESTADLGQDMIEVLTSFCARLYGRRSARNRAKKALETLKP